MFILINLLSAISLLIWSTHIVRNGIMHVYGAHLRRILSNNIKKKIMAFFTGIAVTALVQSSNATTLLVVSFVSQKLLELVPALIIVLGADVGTALMARILTYDLSWLSPLCIFFGVFFFLSKKQLRIAQVGRISIGFGLMLLSLKLIIEASKSITNASGVKVIFSSLTGDIMLDALVGTIFSIVSYSSLAAVLIIATLAETGIISLQIALCLVIGANLGSGILVILNNSNSNFEAKRVAFGSLLFKLIGCIIILPTIPILEKWLIQLPYNSEKIVIFFHVFYNLIRCTVMIPFAKFISIVCIRFIRDEPEYDSRIRPKHLDISALDSPVLALVNAARETLRIGDILEQMMFNFVKILHGNTREQKRISKLDDDVDVLYTAIKLYLAQMQKDDLAKSDSRRWAEIIETALNLEQAGDIIERMSCDVADKSLAKKKLFSLEGLKELESLQEQLLNSLRLSLSVFLSGDFTSAKKLHRYKHRFRVANRRYSHAHVERLHQHNLQSIETSALHLGLLGDMKRLNSLFCSVAYAILEKKNENRNKIKNF